MLPTWEIVRVLFGLRSKLPLTCVFNRWSYQYEQTGNNHAVFQSALLSRIKFTEHLKLQVSSCLNTSFSTSWKHHVQSSW